MTDLLEVRARRTSSILELTILDHSLDISGLERLDAVLANRDARTRRIGQETRLRGYALGLLVDCAARHQLGDARAGRAHAFITDFVRTEYADPDGDHVGEAFDPESFAVPDDGETTPESAFVLDHFVRRCEVTARHGPGRDQAIAAFAAGRRWKDVPDALRRRFELKVEMVSESVAELFADETWWTAYTL
jgi:hypothetical protein